MMGEAKRREEYRKQMIPCPYCQNTKIPNPKVIFRHLIILADKRGNMDAHGPLNNNVFMFEAIRFLEYTKRKYAKPVKRKWWQF